jgi:hypothetical protein
LIVCNFQSWDFNIPSTYQSGGSAPKVGCCFLNYRVTMKCYQRRSAAYTDSESVCATGISFIFDLWMSNLTVQKTQNYNTSTYTGFYMGSQNTLPGNRKILTLSRTKFMAIHFSAELTKTADVHR